MPAEQAGAAEHHLELVLAMEVRVEHGLGALLHGECLRRGPLAAELLEISAHVAPEGLGGEGLHVLPRLLVGTGHPHCSLLWMV